MVDAIRVCLGLRPLFFIGESHERLEDRCHMDEVTLPASGPAEYVWFRGAPGAPGDRNAFRDLSVGMALKRKALRFGGSRKDRRG